MTRRLTRRGRFARAWHSMCTLAPISCSALRSACRWRRSSPAPQLRHEFDQEDRAKDDCRPEVADGRQSLLQEESAGERGKQALGRKDDRGIGGWHILLADGLQGEGDRGGADAGI